MIMRLDAAKIAAPLVHPKPRARVVIERAERLDFLLLVMRKARWLTNVIVDHGTMKTFDLAGIAPDGVPYDIHIDMPADAELLDFLLLVMRYEGAPLIMRLDAAKIAAPLI